MMVVGAIGHYARLQASAVEGAASAAGGVAGVIMQTQRAEEQQRRASMH
jgi:hypothetical protein